MEAPGPLLASGRAADVYDLGDGTVLRRYRTDHDCAHEGRVMVWLAEQGLSVPAVHHSGGTDIVMDLVNGPTMMEDLDSRPWRVVRHARLLARLQRSVNEVRAPEWFVRIAHSEDLGEVVHLDLHPMNVILSPDGPVIIDWTNAGQGAGAFDAAMSFVLMSTFETRGVVDRIGQRLFVATFRLCRGRREIKRTLRSATERRLDDENLTAGERDRLQRLIGR